MTKKLTIEVDYENISEESFEVYCKAQALHSVIWEVLQVIRSAVKHGDDEARARYYEEIREKVWEQLNEEGLNHLF